MGRDGPGPPPGFKLFHLVMHASKLLEERCRAELAEFGLHHGQARVVMTLHRHGPMPQTELARRMDVQPPTLSVMLKKLLAQKLVRRARPAGDERAYAISLTPAGGRAAEKIRRVWEDADRVMQDAVGRQLADDTHDRLLRIRNALGGRSPGM